MNVALILTLAFMVACKPQVETSGSQTKAAGPGNDGASAGLFLIDGTSDDEPSGSLGAIYLAYDGAKYYQAGIPTEFDQKLNQLNTEFYDRIKDKKKLLKAPIESISALASKLGAVIPEGIKGAFAYKANVAKDEVVAKICKSLIEGQVDRVVLMGYSRGGIQALGAARDIVLKKKCARNPDFVALVLIDAVSTLMGPTWSLKVPNTVAALHITKAKNSQGMLGEQNPLFRTAKISGAKLRTIEFTKELAESQRPPNHQRVSADPFVGNEVLKFLSTNGLHVGLNYEEVVEKARHKARQR